MKIEYKDFYSAEEVKNIYKKSVYEQKKRTEAKWKKIVVLTTGITIAVTILASAVTTGIKEHNSNKKYNQDFENASALTTSIVEDNKITKYDSTKKDMVTYYEALPIAEHLVNNGENFDAKLYEAYHAVKNTGSFGDAEIKKTMDDILKWVNICYRGQSGNELSDAYKNFEKYVISLGFVNENGEANYKAYSEAFMEHIVHTERAKNILDESESSELGGR